MKKMILVMGVVLVYPCVASTINVNRNGYEDFTTIQAAIDAVAGKEFAVEGYIVSQEWCARYNGPGNNNDKSRAIATDGLGNVYVTGSSYGVGTGQDYGTVKYDREGNMLWAVRYNGPGNTYDSATDLAVDGSGNVYVTGESVGIDNKMDYATIKYDTNGSQLWVARYTESANTEKYARGIAIDSLGNVYVTGFAYHNSADWVTVKYSPTGEQLWVDTFNGPQEIDDQARDIVVDGSGCVYVTGTSNSLYSLIWMRYMAADYATIKYSSDGVRQWVATYDGPGNTIDIPSSMVLDNSSNLYVTGGSDGNYATIKYDSTNGNQLWVARDYPGHAVAIGVDVAENVYITGTHYEASGFDYATIKYDSNGNQLWASTYDGPRNDIDQAYAMAVDESGNTYVTGESFGTDSGSDYATIKYDTEGNELWVARYDGPASSADWATAITLDGWGNIYVTGGSLGAATYDYATVKYLQHPAILEVPGEYSTIQAAIDAAVDGDVVIVSPGTYQENIHMKNGVTLQGSGANTTIIDGGGNGHVVVFNLASGSISDFTITNSGSTPGYVGGIFTSQCTVRVEDCIIIGNNHGIIFPSNSNGIITGNKIISNGDHTVKITSSYAIITNNLIAHNSRSGIYCYHSSPLIANNTIVNNRYGIRCNPVSPQSIFNNIIVQNEYGIMALGGGSSPVPLLNISYNDVWDNFQANYWYEWGIICIPEDPFCQPVGGSEPFEPQPGNGEISLNPLFVDSVNDNYHLTIDSPCINNGEPAFVPEPGATDIDNEPRVRGGRIDMGAYEFNHNPIADAGHDQTVYACIDGIAEVTLDGSDSNDIDGDQLSYHWSWMIGVEFYDANGVAPTIELPVGEHIIELIVNDGIEDSEPNEVVVTVVGPVEAHVHIVPRVINRNRRGREVMAIITLPEGIGKNDIDGEFTLYPGEITAGPQFVRENDGIVKVFALFDKSALIAAVSSNGPVELTVVGRLTSGEYVSGWDSVRITQP